MRLQVADLDRSIAYYQNVIGFRVHRTRRRPRRRLVPHNDDRVIVELRATAGRQSGCRRGHIGLYHFAICFPIAQSLGRFVEHLAGRGEHAGMSDHLVSEAVYLTTRMDWASRCMRIAALGRGVSKADSSRWRRSRSTWTAVVAAAGGEKWSGAPAGRCSATCISTSATSTRPRVLPRRAWVRQGRLGLSGRAVHVRRRYHHHLGTNTWAANAPQATEEDARLLEWEVIVPAGATSMPSLRAFSAPEPPSSAKMVTRSRAILGNACACESSVALLRNDDLAGLGASHAAIVEREHAIDPHLCDARRDCVRVGGRRAVDDCGGIEQHQIGKHACADDASVRNAEATTKQLILRIASVNVMSLRSRT